MMITFSKLLRAAQSFTKRQMLLLAAVLLVLFGMVIAFSLGNDKVAVSVVPTTKKTAAKEAESTTAAAAPAVTLGETVASNTVSSTQTAARPRPQQPASQAPPQIVAPQNPPTSPAQQPVAPPVEEPTEGSVVVIAGGASESITLATDDGSLVRWYSCNLGAVMSDDQLPDKPAFKVYLVMESAVIDENGLVPASSVTFHVRATADAPLGLLEYTGGDPMVSLSLAFCLADENHNPVQVFQIPVMVVAPTEQ